MTPVVGQCNVCRSCVLENEPWTIDDEQGLCHNQCLGNPKQTPEQIIGEIEQNAKNLFDPPKRNGYWRTKKKKKRSRRK